MYFTRENKKTKINSYYKKESEVQTKIKGQNIRKGKGKNKGQRKITIN